MEQSQEWEVLCQLNIQGAEFSVVKERDWPWKMILKPKIPNKINCFTWLLTKEVILTQENLSKRGHQLVAECSLCGEQPVAINHLVLHCKWTNQLWSMFISLNGVKWVKPGSIAGVYGGQSGLRGIRGALFKAAYRFLR